MKIFSKIHATSALLAAVMLLATCPCAQAGLTEPDLAIGRVTATPSGSGSVVDVLGNWEFDALMQVEFPLMLVASQGENFVRIPVNGQGGDSGSLPALVDGLDPSEIAALEAAALPAAEASLLRVEPHRITVALPALIGDGLVSIEIYVIVPDYGRFVSNRVSVEVAGIDP
ncbi:MAG: hypothetical protein HRT46_03310 [Deltaproteobacteria bacterium]|nr:hypothetical protein [Deltaproteobacteria bacterium]